MHKKIFALVFTFVLLISNAVASTTTYERTLDNLRVSSDIEVYNRNIILSIPSVNESEKIYDFANLFSNSEEVELYNKVTEFINNSDLDMVIVTIDDNPRYSAMNYADDFYDYNYFGKGSTHDGILFLIDMDTREMWISTTGSGQLMYDDYRIDKILDSTYSEIAKEKYYECADAFIDKASYYYNLGIPDSNENAYINEYGDYIYDEEEDILANIIIIIIPSFIISLIIVFIMKGKHKTIKKATTAFSYMKEKAITYKEDTFLTTNTIKVYDPPSSSSSGGGSSTHRSSSGRSHGGGGRRF